MENFFRKLFLSLSGFLATLLIIGFVFKNGPIVDFLNSDWMTNFAKIFLIVWPSSFVIWLALMLFNGNVGKFLRSERILSKKIGFVILFIWFASIITFITFILNSSTSVLVTISFFGILLLFPIWIFLLGNKLVKIIAVLLFVVLIVVFLTFKFIARPHKLVGSSMSPSYNDGEYALFERLSYYFSSPKRGDVVTFIPPDNPDDEFYARIVGLPGEKISIKNGRVFINGIVLDEPYFGPNVYTDAGTYFSYSDVSIPQNSYAIFGDNRAHSNDSRYYGFVNFDLITGKLFSIYWKSSKGLNI